MATTPRDENDRQWRITVIGSDGTPQTTKGVSCTGFSGAVEFATILMEGYPGCWVNIEIDEEREKLEDYFRMGWEAKERNIAWDASQKDKV
ncbi:hypothetical protein ACRBEV_25675 [Methylobacterium phyllosphaerae]